MIDRNLITFLTMVEEQNTIRCAEKLHLTQPAVTQHLHHLEQEYQVTLFQKVGRKLVLTQQGRELYEMVSRLYTMDKQIIARIGKNKTTPLRFGVTHSINEGIMTQITGKFVEHYVNRTIQMTVQNTKTLLQQLEQGKIEFALIEGNFCKEKYYALPFMQANFVALCKANGKYSRSCQLEDLLSGCLLLREEGSGSRDILENILLTKGNHLSDFKTIHQFESIPIILTMIEQDIGVTFAYEQIAKKRIEQGRLMRLPKSVLEVIRQWYFVALPYSPFEKELEEIFLFLQQAIQNINNT